MDIGTYSKISAYMINDLYWPPIMVRIRYNVLLLIAKSQQGPRAKMSLN